MAESVWQAKLSEKPSALDILRSSTLLNSFRSEDFEALAPVSHVSYAERGETIWLTGEDISFFGVVGIGFVKMVRGFDTGQEVTIEIMGPGQVFGLLGAMDGTGCPLEARAVNNLWYLKVPKKDFLAVSEDREGFKKIILRRTTGRLRQSNDIFSRMVLGKIDERIATVLFMLVESFGQQNDDGSLQIEVPLTRQDISEMAGTTVETTIRIMSKWQKEGVVSTRNRHVTIARPDFLEELTKH